MISVSGHIYDPIQYHQFQQHIQRLPSGKNHFEPGIYPDKIEQATVNYIDNLANLANLCSEAAEPLRASAKKLCEKAEDEIKNMLDKVKAYPPNLTVLKQMVLLDQLSNHLKCHALVNKTTTAPHKTQLPEFDQKKPDVYDQFFASADDLKKAAFLPEAVLQNAEAETEARLAMALLRNQNHASSARIDGMQIFRCALENVAQKTGGARCQDTRYKQYRELINQRYKPNDAPESPRTPPNNESPRVNQPIQLAPIRIRYKRSGPA